MKNQWSFLFCLSFAGLLLFDPLANEIIWLLLRHLFGWWVVLPAANGLDVLKTAV